MTEQTPDMIEQNRERAWSGGLSYVLVFLSVAGVADVQSLIAVLTQSDHSLPLRAFGVALSLVTTGLWLGFLYQEWKDRHYRALRARWRGYGVGVQTFIVLAGVITAANAHHWKAIPFPIVANLIAIGIWRTWIKANALPAKYQASLDQIIEEYYQREIPISRTRRHSEELNRAAAPYLRNSLTDPFSEPVAFDIPTGKHEPLVYFIRHGDRVKIGTTTDLRKRVVGLSLRVDNVALILPGDAEVEHAYHRRFDALRVGDTEWFTDEPPLSDFIATWAQKVGRPHE